MPVSHPRLRFTPRHEQRWRRGHPWVFSNEIRMDAAAKALPPGTVVTMEDANGEPLGTGYFNPHTLIAVRRLADKADVAIDVKFWHERLEAARDLRDRMYYLPFYRLVHAEADRLPALIIDRMGDVLVVQMNAAGIERAADDILQALTTIFQPRAIVLKNDSPVRELEGLPAETRIAYGTIDHPVVIQENGCSFELDLLNGQKTGWFHDQRENRAFVASLSESRSVLDVYSYVGGFAIAAAKAGASGVVAIDRSAAAVTAIDRSAVLNEVDSLVTAVRSEAFEELERRVASGETFDVVVLDPPAFVKSKKDLGAGLRGYAKLVRLGARLTAKGGVLFAASCSHHADPVSFAEAVSHGLVQAGRTGRILRSSGAGPDHPVHPLLPESAYLKALTLQLD